MFEQTFVDGVGRTKRPYTILLSLAIQVVMIGVLVIIPLIYFDALPGASLSASLVAPPPPPPPPPQVVKVAHTAPKQFIANQLMAPKSVPSKILMVTEEEAPLSSGVVGGIPGGMPGGGGGVLGGIIGGLPAAAPPPPPKAAPPPPKPVGPQRIGGNVQAANLINAVKPVYPPLAKMARQQGTVKFEATISKEGTIEDLKLVSGPPLLVPAAMEAVKQWRYKPTLLNGDAVEVLTTIDVNFSLSN